MAKPPGGKRLPGIWAIARNARRNSGVSTRCSPRSTPSPCPIREKIMASASGSKFHRACRSGVATGGTFFSANRRPRSEEHTSELQSHLNLVCRLLLEKKNSDYDIDFCDYHPNDLRHSPPMPEMFADN